MNTEDSIKSFSEIEWESQERALFEERTGPVAGLFHANHLVARALLHPPLDPIPGGLAATVAAKTQIYADVNDERFEVTLQYLAIALLLVASVAASLLFVDLWIATFAMVSAHMALVQWVAIAGFCSLLSLAFGRTRLLYTGSVTE